MSTRSLAATLMLLSGLVIVALSVGFTAFVLLHPEWLDRQIAQAADQAQLPRDQLALVRGPVLTRAVWISGALGAAEGGLSMLLGWLVLRGKRWAFGTSIAVTTLRLLLVGLCALVIVGGLALGQAAPGGGLNAILTLLICGVLVATIVLLVLARRALPPPLPKRFA